LKALFIGGTGVISSACTDLALTQGIELTLLNRGSSTRSIPSGVEVINADIRDSVAVKAATAARKWDAVVDFISFTPEHVKSALDAFIKRTSQYVFISSASAYRKPPVSMPVVESNLLFNPFWEYSRNKIACEELLVNEYRNSNFPITIIRPSHTYDKTLLPMDGGWTVVDRMIRGKEVIVHGDGSSLWTLTHHRDFAVGLIGLLGHSFAIGEAFHITGDEWLSWDEIFRLVARAAGVEAKIVHVASDTINRFNPDWGAGLLGDKSHSMIFDNSKIKRVVPAFKCTIPFARGVEEILNWYLEDPKRQKIDADFAEKYERILAYEKRK